MCFFFVQSIFNAIIVQILVLDCYSVEERLYLMLIG